MPLRLLLLFGPIAAFGRNGTIDRFDNNPFRLQFTFYQHEPAQINRHFLGCVCVWCSFPFDLIPFILICLLILHFTAAVFYWAHKRTRRQYILCLKWKINYNYSNVDPKNTVDLNRRCFNKRGCRIIRNNCDEPRIAFSLINSVDFLFFSVLFLCSFCQIVAIAIQIALLECSERGAHSLWRTAHHSLSLRCSLAVDASIHTSSSFMFH